MEGGHEGGGKEKGVSDTMVMTLHGLLLLTC